LFEVLFYSDNADAGDLEQGIRNEAMIVARKHKQVKHGA
jgi:hypothetical protein